MAIHLQAIIWGYDYGHEVGLREEELPSLVPHVVHLWGRWTPSRGEFDRMLHLCTGPARGAFAFTMIES